MHLFRGSGIWALLFALFSGAIAEFYTQSQFLCLTGYGNTSVDPIGTTYSTLNWGVSYLTDTIYSTVLLTETYQPSNELNVSTVTVTTSTRPPASRTITIRRTANFTFTVLLPYTQVETVYETTTITSFGTTTISTSSGFVPAASLLGVSSTSNSSANTTSSSSSTASPLGKWKGKVKSSSASQSPPKKPKNLSRVFPPWKRLVAAQASSTDDGSEHTRASATTTSLNLRQQVCSVVANTREGSFPTTVSCTNYITLYTEVTTNTVVTSTTTISAPTSTLYSTTTTTLTLGPRNTTSSSNSSSSVPRTAFLDRFRLWASPKAEPTQPTKPPEASALRIDYYEKRRPSQTPRPSHGRKKFKHLDSSTDSESSTTDEIVYTEEAYTTLTYTLYNTSTPIDYASTPVTVTATLTQNVTVFEPVAVYYAACADENLYSGMGSTILTGFSTSGGAADLSRVSTYGAYECCVVCQTTPGCSGSLFHPEGDRNVNCALLVAESKTCNLQPGFFVGEASEGGDAPAVGSCGCVPEVVEGGGSVSCDDAGS